MCDYSLHSVKSRPAKIGDKLTTRDFGTGTRGFAASEDASVAVCVRPGTELSFPDEKAAASAVLAAAAGGSLFDVETTVAMTAKDAANTFESAGKAAKAFRSAGRS